MLCFQLSVYVVLRYDVQHQFAFQWCIPTLQSELNHQTGHCVYFWSNEFDHMIAIRNLSNAWKHYVPFFVVYHNLSWLTWRSYICLLLTKTQLKWFIFYVWWANIFFSDKWIYMRPRRIVSIWSNWIHLMHWLFISLPIPNRKFFHFN